MSVTASSLIVVSNRLPFTLDKTEGGGLKRQSSAGGLVMIMIINNHNDNDNDNDDVEVTAVAPVVIQSKGLWIGWPGPNVVESDVIPEADPTDTSPTSGLASSQVN